MCGRRTLTHTEAQSLAALAELVSLKGGGGGVTDPMTTLSLKFYPLFGPERGCSPKNGKMTFSCKIFRPRTGGSVPAIPLSANVAGYVSVWKVADFTTAVFRLAVLSPQSK